MNRFVLIINWEQFSNGITIISLYSTLFPILTCPIEHSIYQVMKERLCCSVFQTILSSFTTTNWPCCQDLLTLYSIRPILYSFSFNVFLFLQTRRIFVSTFATARPAYLQLRNVWTRLTSTCEFSMTSKAIREETSSGEIQQYHAHPELVCYVPSYISDIIHVRPELDSNALRKFAMVTIRQLMMLRSMYVVIVSWYGIQWRF